MLKHDLSKIVVFETSFEVCNKIGGIYTVIKTKISNAIKHFKENYFLVGPYFAQAANSEFLEKALPSELNEIANELRAEGIILHCGKWIADNSNANVFLIDYSRFWSQIDIYKKRIWDYFRVDSLGAPYDYDEPFIFGIAVGKFLEKVSKIYSQKTIIFHFHEWLTGSGLLYLKSIRQVSSNFKLIFTIHATVFGRSVINANKPLYENMDSIDSEKEVINLNIRNKFSLELQSIKQADSFSCVSQITSYEAEKFYGRKADVICPNGLDIKNLPTFEEISIEHHIKREVLREFLFFYFFPYYKFAVEKTLFFFTSGRPEFRAKGYDVFIRALGLLNQDLKKDSSFDKTIVTFFLIPFDNLGPRSELFLFREKFLEIKRLMAENQTDLIARLTYLTMENKQCDLEFLFSSKVFAEIKRMTSFFKKNEGEINRAPFSTHELKDENNEYIRSFLDNGLLNRKEDKVKVVFIPVYLKGHDGLINLDYQEFIKACHLGIFPSYYEPFGYTPLESIAVGVSALTTDLSGCGQFLMSYIKSKKNPGVFIIKRFNQSDEKVAKELFNVLRRYSYFNLRQRVENKINAIRLSTYCDWGKLIENYIKLYLK